MTRQASYNDGVVKIYAVSNAAAPGKKPVRRLAIKETLRYARRTVGVKRMYLAMQANAQIDLLLRVPYRGNVATHDIAIPIDGRQYEIAAIQTIEGTQPPVMDLTLRRLEVEYDLS